MADGSRQTVHIAGIGGIPASSVTAAVVTVTAFSPTGDGAIRLFPADGDRPVSSNLLYHAGSNASNTALVQLSANGDLAVENKYASADVSITLTGYFTNGGSGANSNFSPTANARLVDTRNGTGIASAAPIQPGNIINVPVAGASGIPATATAVAVNFSALQATGKGWLTAWANGSNASDYRLLSFDPAGPSSSLTTVPIGADGSINVKLTSAASDVLIDIQGYFDGSSTGPTTGSFVTYTDRLYDSRDSGELAIAAGATRSVPGLPYGAKGRPVVALHLGVVDATGTGGLRVWGDGDATPSYNEMNFSGTSASSLEFVRPGADGIINIKNTSTAAIDIIVDLQGLFPDNAATSSADLGVVVGADGWLNYTNTQASSLDLQNPTTTVVDGIPDPDGGCDFTDNISATATSTEDVYSEEVGYNPATCQDRVLTGTLTEADQTTLNQADSQVAANSSTTDPLNAPLTSSQSAPTDSTGSGYTSLQSAGSTSYGSAHINTQWIDPFFITITAMTNNLRWPLYGAGGTVSGRVNPYEFPYDGWSSSGVKPSPLTIGSVTNGWQLKATDHFTNRDFATFVYLSMGLSGWLACGAPTTNRADFYHGLTITGYRDNTYSTSHAGDHKSGACANLVHHKTRVARGWFG